MTLAVLVIISSTCTSVMSLVHQVHEGYKLCLKYLKYWSMFFKSQGHEASQVHKYGKSLHKISSTNILTTWSITPVPKKYPKSFHNISSTNINSKKNCPRYLGYLRDLCITSATFVISLSFDVCIQTSFVHGFLVFNEKCTIEENMHFICIFRKHACIFQNTVV